jgi:hypothetical protein
MGVTVMMQFIAIQVISLVLIALLAADRPVAN